MCALAQRYLLGVAVMISVGVSEFVSVVDHGT